MALTDIKVRSAKSQEKEYTLVDGDGMFLLIHPNGSKLVPLSRQALAILKQFHNLSGERDFVFVSDHNPRKPMSENTVNKALRVMSYDTKVDVCGHGFRTMACSSLIESGLWSRDAVERQMSHMERNSMRAAYIHKAEHLDERRLMLQWWADYLDINRVKGISPFDFAKLNAS
ncbi:putative integrase [Citrobacter rodentium ICC168]|uniref:Integrase n=1 Tax=Citrobacter rodentium (strain ICC168) TaxID=637910 RepID=D2TP25_CITRI|nr:putative integrase [Citrobacter rodentium ICC168]